jgi:hypothetical protein
MSDTNISEKIMENMTNIIKKSFIIEKTNKIENIFIGVALCSTIIGLFTIYNTNKCVKIENKIENLENLIKEKSNISRVNYKILLECQNIIYNMDVKIKNMDHKIENMDHKIEKYNTNTDI